MEVDAGTAGAARGAGRGDVHGAVDGLEELPEDRGGDMAQGCSLTAGEQSSHEAPVEAEAAVADGVDPAVDAVEMAARNPIPNRPCSQTSRFKLLSRHRPMLARRDPRHR